MDYEVTCSNCGRRYRLSAAPGQTINSVCPNCGYKMTVALPKVQTGYDIQAEDKEIAGNDNNGAGSYGREHHGHVTTILLAIVLGLLAGVVVWLGYRQKVRNDIETHDQMMAARKAHRDSLMMLRNQQEAEEREARQAEINQRTVVDFLTKFYSQMIAGESLPDNYAGNLSEQLYQSLTSDTIPGNGGKVDWLAMGPESMLDKTKDFRGELIKNLKILHLDDNWYRVRFMADGMSEFRDVEAFPYKGKVIINAVR